MNKIFVAIALVVSLAACQFTVTKHQFDVANKMCQSNGGLKYVYDAYWFSDGREANISFICANGANITQKISKE